MARSSFQKLKILYVMQYLLRNTDEAHPASVAQLIRFLAEHNISAERKSIYDDIEALRDYGMDIIQTSSGKVHGYYVASSDFELPELKLLVDSVQSSKFITQKKTMTLIKKIESLTNIYAAQLFTRQVFVKNRIKAMNESIYYNVDEIHNGIAQNRKIRFHYFDFTVQKERHLRKDGAYYEVSPFAMTWDDENYYLVGYDSEVKKIKHFRVDKMLDIALTDAPRDGLEVYQNMDMAVYARKVFGMFSGDEVPVSLRFDNQLVGAVIDRLGREVMLIPDGDDHFTVRTDVVVSPQFFAWVCGFGGKAEILGPDRVVMEFKRHIWQICEVYSK